jgi:hypothetical protein
MVSKCNKNCIGQRSLLKVPEDIGTGSDDGLGKALRISKNIPKQISLPFGQRHRTAERGAKYQVQRSLHKVPEDIGTS